jgi:peptidoglycan hydrolase CwlO-like protein
VAGGVAMANADGLEKQLEQMLERQLADAHARIREMIQEIDRRDELIADLQRRIEELEQAMNSRP